MTTTALIAVILTDFGVDSLMAVELVNWIKKEMGITVSQLDILGIHDTIRGFGSIKASEIYPQFVKNLIAFSLNRSIRTFEI